MQKLQIHSLALRESDKE